MYTSGDFILRRDDTPFANRQKLLFDGLLTAERECQKDKAVPRMDMDIDESRYRIPKIGSRPICHTKRFLGKESIFKRPERPAPRTNLRSIPDHHRNPHKWVKYSLDDVSNEDMTDQSNKQAALSFLKELRARKSQQQEDCLQSKMDIDETEPMGQNQIKMPFKQRSVKTHSEIEFKKPKADIESTDHSPVIIDRDDKPVFRSSKIIMPEYVVGQKQKRKIKREKRIDKVVARSKELKLDHLQEPDPEDD